jgi:hypothetical protein
MKKKPNNEMPPLAKVELEITDLHFSGRIIVELADRRATAVTMQRLLEKARRLVPAEPRLVPEVG